MDTPLIIINGNKGKTSTIKYFSYITGNFYKYNVLTYNVIDNVITDILINDKISVNIEEHKKDVSYKNLINEHSIQENEEKETLTELALLLYLIIRYKIDFIITKPNAYTKFFNHICSGLTTVENYETQDVNYLINLLLSNDFITNNIPLISCAHVKDLTNIIINLCDKYKSPFILTNFYHLKYIEYDTKLNTRYSYVNIAIALTILDFIQKFYNPQLRSIESVKWTKYKISTYNYHKVLVGNIPINLPSLKNMIFDNSYSKIIKKNNITFYIDSGGSYKSNNLITEWFKNSTKNDIHSINLCVFSCKENDDLIRTILPLTTINFESLYLIDYKYKGKTMENILSLFDKFEYRYWYEETNWTETLYNIFNYIYSEEKYEYFRKESILPLNEYMGFEEIRFDNNEHMLKTILPPNPNLIIDDLNSVSDWILNISNTNSKIKYNVLITGDKIITQEYYNLIHLL
jgi:folylpolyglutamate synthase/dihydropteroate synthase